MIAQVQFFRGATPDLHNRVFQKQAPLSFGYLEESSFAYLFLGLYCHPESNEGYNLIMSRQYFVYILTTKNNKLLYIGVTNNLERRIWEHKQKTIPGYTQKYNLNKLVYYQEFVDINDAILVEKKLKGWLRSKKENLINNFNPDWKDLS